MSPLKNCPNLSSLNAQCVNQKERLMKLKVIIFLSLIMILGGCSKYDFNPATTIGRIIIQNDS
tara:strand:+ start:48 stop:236 length:189 start_codon:yes stop_codon:yes gene_type:complete